MSNWKEYLNAKIIISIVVTFVVGAVIGFFGGVCGFNSGSVAENMRYISRLENTVSEQAGLIQSIERELESGESIDERLKERGTTIATGLGKVELGLTEIEGQQKTNMEFILEGERAELQSFDRLKELENILKEATYKDSSN